MPSFVLLNQNTTIQYTSSSQQVYCMKYQLTVFHGGSKRIFLYPPKKLLVSVLGGGSKKLKLAYCMKY